MIETALAQLLTAQAVLCCLAVAILLDAVKGLTPPFWERPWPNRLLPLVAISLGCLLGLLPGFATGPLATRLVWGAVCGGLSTGVYAAARKFARGQAGEPK